MTSKAQKLARIENWSLAQLHCTASVLRGLCRHPFVSSIFKTSAEHMRNVCLEEIQCIKRQQRMRMGRSGHYIVKVDSQTYERDTEGEVWHLYFACTCQNMFMVRSPSNKDLSMFRGMNTTMDKYLDKLEAENASSTN